MKDPLEKVSVLVIAFLLSLAGPFLAAPNPGWNGSRQPVMAYASDEEGLHGTPESEAHSSDELSEWESLRSDEYGFEFRYPPDGKLQTYSSTSKKIVKVDLPVPEETLLQEKFLLVKVKNNSGRCAGNFSLDSQEVALINGLKFTKKEFEEGATGDIYERMAYSTKRENKCFILDFVLHSTNPEVYESPPPDFDRSESEVFRKIVSTFRFL